MLRDKLDESIMHPENSSIYKEEEKKNVRARDSQWLQGNSLFLTQEIHICKYDSQHL